MGIMKYFQLNELSTKIKNPYRYFKFIAEFRNFSHLSEFNNKRFSILWHNRYPCLTDNSSFTAFDHHYVYHLAWAARKISQIRPVIHYDISSSLHFCSIVSAFIPVKFYDYRPAKLSLSNLSSDHADITSLPLEDNIIPSLSCMHTVEHIGLGRYGDPIDPEGDLKGIAELKRVLAPGGNLLFVVPIGKEAIVVFNAHRIYTYSQIISYFDNFELVEFSLICDDPSLDDFIENAEPQFSEQCSYGCGCFWFKKGS